MRRAAGFQRVPYANELDAALGVAMELGQVSCRHGEGMRHQGQASRRRSLVNRREVLQRANGIFGNTCGLMTIVPSNPRTQRVPSGE